MFFPTCVWSIFAAAGGRTFDSVNGVLLLHYTPLEDDESKRWSHQQVAAAAAAAVEALVNATVEAAAAEVAAVIYQACSLDAVKAWKNGRRVRCRSWWS
jgi:hypothetical protein